MENTRDSLRNLYEQMGEKAFAAKTINLINEDKITEYNFSLKALWEAMDKPKLSTSRLIESRVYDEEELSEALESSAFPKITGALINKVVSAAYDKEYGIGMQLVDVVPSSQKDEVIVGFAEDNTLQEVPEGMPYQEGSITEKYHKIRNRKFGRVIGLTEEMVKFDQTNQMITRAKRVGEAAKAKQERIIMDAVLENVSTGQYAAWRPNGTATTLYSSTSNDPFSSGTLDNLGGEALLDETDIATAITLAAQFQDENGDPIMWNPKVLLVPMALEGIGRQIVYSGQSIKLTLPGGVFAPYQGMILLSSPYIDQLISATAWYIGDFQKEFIYTEVFPLQVFQAKVGNEDEFNRDIIFRFKARFMGGCGAVSNRYVVKGNV